MNTYMGIGLYRLSVLVGSSLHHDAAVFHFLIHIHVFLWQLTCLACSHIPFVLAFKIMILAINVEPDSRNRTRFSYFQTWGQLL